MNADLTPEQITQSVLLWPTERRMALLDALHDSLVDPSIDHGSEDPAEEVEAAWNDEIGQRIADIESGSVKTVPAEEAERMIRGDAPAP